MSTIVLIVAYVVLMVDAYVIMVFLVESVNFTYLALLIALLLKTATAFQMENVIAWKGILGRPVKWVRRDSFQ